MAGLLSRERIVAGPGFNRWLVPPAALAIHSSIGQAYAFSVFKLPLTKVLGITEPAPGDWKQTELAWIFTIAIVFLGLSAAVFGRWLEHAGPRKSGVVAACCWGARLLRLRARRQAAQHLAALPRLRRARRLRTRARLHHAGLHPDQVVSRPPRHGHRAWPSWASAAARMIASPLSQLLLDHYQSPTSVGVAETFVTLGVIYLVRCCSGRFCFRVPAAGLDSPPDWAPPAGERSRPDHPAPRARGPGRQDRAVLLAVGRAVPQRDRRASASWSRRRR